MNVNWYVNAIVRKIRCSKKRKKEIKKQLLADIQTRTGHGETLETIVSQMGTAREIAEEFNADISEKEQKQYTLYKILKIIIFAAAIFALLMLCTYWTLPKSYDIGQSRYFSKEQVEDAMKNTIELLDAGDYESLQANALPEVLPFLNAETIGEVKGAILDDWGARQKFGAAYLTELVQRGQHMAVGDITVTYEKVSVTYRLSYDKDMRLAGIYIR